MVKIRPETQPGEQRELRLFAARNEFVSFQIGLHGGQTGLAVESVSLPGLKGPSHIPEREITLYREAFIEITRRSAPDSTLGRWPDGLIPDVDETYGEKRLAFPFEVPVGEARAIWVDVRVPEDARPGAYRGSVWVTAANGQRVAIKVHLTVVDAFLPSTPSLRTAFFLAPWYVCRAYTGDLECSEEELMRLLPGFHSMGLDHRISITGGFPRLPGQASWMLRDWETFATQWGPFLDGTAPSRLPGARMTSWQYLGPAGGASLDEFMREARSRGWLPRAFDYVGDEPPWWSTFEEVRQRATLIRREAPELRTLLTTEIGGLQKHDLEELIDILAVLVNVIDGMRPPYEGPQRAKYNDFLAQPNRELWLYQSCVSHGCAGVFAPENKPGQGWPSYMIDRPAAKARALEWVSFLEGAVGELYYQTAERLDTAWTDQFVYAGNGDGTLFYPGMPSIIGGTTNVPVPSIRLKLIRLGIQDYEWLKAVSDAGDPEYAWKIARQLIPAAWRVPDDGALFEAARLCLIHRYLELTGAYMPIETLQALGALCMESPFSQPEG